MKVVLGIMLVCVLVCVLVSCGGGAKLTDPVKYANELTTITNSVEDGLSELKSAIKSGDYAKAETARVAWVSTLDKSIEKANAIGDFKGNSKVKDAAIATLNAYKDAADDYKKIIEMYDADDKGTPLDENAESALWNSVQNKLHAGGTGMNAAISKFQESL